jgi:hypothetical protein
MAGYAYGLDEGGAIPDDSGALPVAASDQQPDNSGALPVVQDAETPQQPQQDQSRSGIDFDASHVPANAKRIIQYLLGAGAAHPDVTSKFATAVKVEHPGTNDDDANTISILKAKEQGGEQAAASLLQSHRQQYNAKQSFAKAALQGVNGKPPDIHAAADAATQASQHVLDGSQAVFYANHGGVTATVKPPGSNQRVSYNLTPQQFSDYLNIAGNGQYDKLLQTGGVAAAIQNIAGKTQQQSSPQQAQAPASKSSGQPIARDVTEGDQPALPNGNPSAHDARTGASWPIPRMGGTQHDPDLEARAAARFGTGVSQMGDREQWMSDEEEKEANRQNKVDVEKEKGTFHIKTEQAKNEGKVGAETEKNKGRVQSATIRANAQVDAAKARAVAEAAKQAAVSGSEDFLHAGERRQHHVAGRH